MKISICGKGGCGKSTVTALLAKELSKNKKVLVIDGDESNISLHRLLGLEKPKDIIDIIGGRKVLKKNMNNISEILKDIDVDSIASKDGNLMLISVGKIRDFGEGCACPMGVLLKELIKNLDYDYVLIDTEAGIEHFGRGVEENVDVILVVIDPTYESIRLANEIERMAKNMGKKVYFIINKVDDNIKDMIMDKINKDRVIAIIPNKREILEKGLLGESLDSIEEIKDIVKTIS
ncbi:CODH nickel-insertion accessory protein CooC [Methanocaldococcus villosus KIN24-T80]|uniref:CODH nickel-insertion accessory protein CooC n=1 Tax=Methanocaldococcus villosus KIN24-T80 TaxID=1069083 RepID=N6UWH2_9EURY|nr:AAA family ATPase [Methanocaldococcus villosus]ENN96674.1 CODH nickel-insertion accessory protein CooC [Methanocaldococcus villosus KIN24-T80]